MARFGEIQNLCTVSYKMLIDRPKPVESQRFLTRAHIWCKSITFAALKAHVVKLADTSDLGSDAVRYGGSSPSMGTYINYRHTYYRNTRKVLIPSVIFLLLF